MMEVDDAGDGVGAVHRGGTTGDDFGAPSISAVGMVLRSVTCSGPKMAKRRPLTSVRLRVGTEAAKIARRRRRCAEPAGTWLAVAPPLVARTNCGSITQHLVDVRRARQLEFFGVDDRERCRSILTSARDARTGDDDDRRLSSTCDALWSCAVQPIRAQRTPGHVKTNTDARDFAGVAREPIAVHDFPFVFRLETDTGLEFSALYPALSPIMDERICLSKTENRSCTRADIIAGRDLIQTMGT